MVGVITCELGSEDTLLMVGRKKKVPDSRSPISIGSVWMLPQLVSMEVMSQHGTVVGIFMVCAVETGE